MKSDLDRELENVPRPVRALAAISAGILCLVLLTPVCVEIVRAQDWGQAKAEQEWDKLKNDIEKAEQAFEEASERAEQEKEEEGR